MTQLNTPYPATAHLTGFLQLHGYTVEQRDPAIELMLKILSPAGLNGIKAELEANFAEVAPKDRPAEVQFFLDHFTAYLGAVAPCVRFLQGKDPTLAARLASRRFLPEGVGFAGLHQMEEIEGEAFLMQAFGAIGTQDQAKYLASLYVGGIARVVSTGIDPRFELTRYGEHLAASNPAFDDLHMSLTGEESYIDELLREIVLDYLEDTTPDALAITLPFPGNVYAGLKIAQTAKKWDPQLKVILGGGYVNTELRSVSEPRLFDYADYVCLDDGKLPLLHLLEHIAGERPREELVRTFVRDQNRVTYLNAENYPEISHSEAGTPTYRGLPMSDYLSLCEMPNPMHRIWSDGRWNKLVLAHGCYWRKCSFCDVSLDYIARYDPADEDIILERMEALIAETGQTGFHFADEAAPPKLLAALAEKIIAKGLAVSWWGNIRFEKAFTPAVARLLAASGCIAVSGGLEAASDRLLGLMNKGVSVRQVARVTHALTEAGIMVHAYLMYGFPSQTAQETIEALEYVRQLFQSGCIQSAYWHRFAATVHSPVGKNPQKFGITPVPCKEARFARNDFEYTDSIRCNHDRLGAGLKRALYNYMHGMGLDEDLQIWFDQRIARPKVPPDFIASALQGQ